VSAQVIEGKGGRHYVLVGSTYQGQHLEANFQVGLVNRFDAGGQTDAGGTEETAMEITPGVLAENNLTYALDELDTFKFKARGGVAYQFKARPVNDSTMRLEACDSEGVKLGNGRSPNAGAVAKIEKISVAQDGWVYLRVAAFHQSEAPELIYSLALGEGAVDSPPRPKAGP
jgi:hypothetical protein